MGGSRETKAGVADGQDWGVSWQRCRETPRVTVHGTVNTVHNAAVLPR